MNKGALALLIHGGTDNWSPPRWNEADLTLYCAGRRVILLPRSRLRPCGKSITQRSGSRRPGSWPVSPILRVIFNLGAGVDALMADTTLPNVPLVRVAGVPISPAAHDRICRTPCADASSAGDLFARKPADEALGTETAMAGECGYGRDLGARHAGRECRACPVSARLPRDRLEPKREADRRPRMLYRRDPARTVSAPN